MKDFNKRGEYTGFNPYLQEVYKQVDPRFGSACVTVFIIAAFMVIAILGFFAFLTWYFGGLWM